MSQRHVLIVTGTCGVGKTTTSRKWASLRTGAAIHGDQIREWLRPQELRRAAKYQEIPLVRICLKAAQEFLDMGLDVAIDNVWTAEGVSLLYEPLSRVATVRVVYLRCDLPENHRRDLLRSPSDVMNARLDELDGELQSMAWPEYVVKLTTTAHSVDDTVSAINSLFL